MTRPPKTRAAAVILLSSFLALAIPSLRGQTTTDTTTIPAGSRVFLAQMNGFENYLTAAIIQENLPLLIVRDRTKADFEITGTSNSPRAPGTDPQEATITVTTVSTGIVVFADSIHLTNTTEGRKTAAEACAESLKAKIERDNRPPSRSPSAPIAESPAVPNVLPANRVIRARVQGDDGHSFIEELRTAFAAQRLTLTVVAATSPYDYSIVLAQQPTGGSPSAAAIMIDSGGNLVASAVDTGFRVKGAVSGCARDLAKKIGALR